MSYLKVDIYMDDSGHEYIVPEYDWDEFYEIVNAIEEASTYSPEWYDAIDDFNTKFSKYMARPESCELWITEEELRKITNGN